MSCGTTELLGLTCKMQTFNSVVSDVAEKTTQVLRQQKVAILWLIKASKTIHKVTGNNRTILTGGDW